MTDSLSGTFSRSECVRRSAIPRTEVTGPRRHSEAFRAFSVHFSREHPLSVFRKYVLQLPTPCVKFRAFIGIRDSGATASTSWPHLSMYTFLNFLPVLRRWNIKIKKIVNFSTSMGTEMGMDEKLGNRIRAKMGRIMWLLWTACDLCKNLDYCGISYMHFEFLGIIVECGITCYLRGIDLTIYISIPCGLAACQWSENGFVWSV